ncbi:zinc-dependent alcohol dehydrogenase family protein [Massilia horti]|uniref:Zinc-binding alcohol dehydrogenase family protein n=1 Tax=Massilia horti TaxID=2562153 RepID=A0A4Y9SQX6_9BURK|nr:zinc-dependent alcohol dehydrogenase family protein [Massilia horti]TFW28981.1 zinc-binding alcohol dehydrogenase family protein [Massilia horti]
MRAMVLERAGSPLSEAEIPLPMPGAGEVLVKVAACGVCRTDLHIVDGELPAHALPLVPGHEVVGTVAAMGHGASRFRMGQRVGIPWLAGTCGHCRYCLQGRENLCDSAVFTGYDLNGGYAEFAVADERYCHALPAAYDDAHAAPLLCAGLIGYRAYAMAGQAQRIGLYGFGAAAHIIAQLAVLQGREVFAFTRPGDFHSQQFARSLGASWAGAAQDPCPAPLDAAILFAPIGELVPRALAASAKGATIVCAGIHMSDIPAFPYALLWGERSVRSVANLTRADGEQFFSLVAQGQVKTAPVVFPLREANDALDALRAGRFDGAAVLVP